MNKYENQKRIIRKNFISFDNTNNLISLALMMLKGRQILEENDALELLKKLDETNNKI